MPNPSSSLRTPLARVRGLGSAHTGARHWLFYRLGAVGLIPLNLWLVISLIGHVGAYHVVITEWMHKPMNATLLLLNIIFSFYHAAYGLEEVCTDYIPGKITRILTIAAIKGLALVLALACSYAVLLVALKS